MTAPSLALGLEQTPSVDFSYLSDLEDVFAFTDWSFLSEGQQTTSLQPQLPEQTTYSPGRHRLHGLPSVDEIDRVGFLGTQAPRTADQQYLQSQRCFSLPPVSILRQIMEYYFKYIHPNLPIIDEYRFAHLWTQEDYRLEGFSFFVFRAMLFAAIHVSV